MRAEVVVTWLLLRRTRYFFPIGGRDHRHYNCAYQGRDGQAELACVSGLRRFTGDVVIHLSNNQAGRRVTSLTRATPLPLSHINRQPIVT